MRISKLAVQLANSMHSGSWEWPSKPWLHLHADCAGPFLGRTFLILVDAHSKWLEVVSVSTPSSQQAFKALRHIFNFLLMGYLKCWSLIMVLPLPV